MKPFLKSVAEDLYKRYGGKLDDKVVVFPNKRAGLFFNEYLLECSGNTPIWSPRYMTISELFQQNSNLVIGDSILLVSKLYKEYIRPKREDESQQEYEKSIEDIDSFYYWGEMLIKDFDDIDKNLADVKSLFANIDDLRKMGTGKDTLTDEQKRSIERFFKNFNPDAGSEVKSSFQSLWERMYTIYCNFKESLRKINVAYEGMLYRDVIERDEKLQLKHGTYIFVGFNALNGAETKFFNRIKESGKALFYWDYDKYYTDQAGHEAGHFMRKNLKLFPNALVDENFRHLTESKKKVTVVSAGTDSIGARYVSTWLDENLTQENVETAIVLCDETLLDPVLHTIPHSANGHALNSMNVTMGYPIQHTPIYSLVKQLVELQTRGWSEKHNAFNLSYVCKLLKHPYVIQGSSSAEELYTYLVKNNVFYPDEELLGKDEFLSMLFTHSANNGEWIENIIKTIYSVAENRLKIAEERDEIYDKLFSEAIMKVHSQAQRLKALHSAGELDMKLSTIGRLFIRLLSSLSVPFHGEPVVGLQLMGLLETRNLDFKNIILLSVNEGAVPRASSESSFVPYNLRKAFGLTLSEHRDSIYAYNFYRLLQRAENVTLVYNSSTDGKYRGECSRYILQLLGSNLFDIEKITLSARQENKEITANEVTKTPEMIKRLRERFDKGYCSEAMDISPSAINRYINCGLDFFYYYVLGLKPIEEISTELEATDIGTIFHTAAELMYEKIVGNWSNTITKNLLEYYVKNPKLLYEFIDAAFKKEFFKKGKVEYNGEQYIKRGVLHNYLLRLAMMDADYADFTYIGSEKSIRISHPLKCNGFEAQLSIGGKIDRIDVKGDTVNIVDYKTGSADQKASISLEDIFGNKTKSAGNRLQAFLYSIALDEIMVTKKEQPSKSDLAWINDVMKTGAKKVAPSLLYMKKSKDKKTNQAIDNVGREECILKLDKEPVTDIKVLKEKFIEHLNGVLYDIFDIEKPFTFAHNDKKCEYCDYKEICGRKYFLTQGTEQ